MMAKRFKFDYKNCLGCEACVVACKQQKKARKGEGVRRVLAVNSNRDKQLPVYNLSFSCNHCKEPKCIEVCKKDAIVKRDYGIVELLVDKCDLCEECIAACPYEAIKYNREKGYITKCNMCVDVVGEDNPFCVKACPTGALSITESEDWNDAQDVLNRVFEDVSNRTWENEKECK